MSAKSDATRWGSVAKFFHWTIALFVIGLLVGGLTMTDMKVSPDKFKLYALHKSIGITVLALVLAATYDSMVPLTICCLTMAVLLGLGTGAVFKLVPEWFPDRVGSVTGVVGAAGGLGGFFPPVVMGIVKSSTGGYALGFILMAVVASLAFLVLVASSRRAAQGSASAERELVAG